MACGRSSRGNPCRKGERDGVGAGPRACPDDVGQSRGERGQPRGVAPTSGWGPVGIDATVRSPGRQGYQFGVGNLRKSAPSADEMQWLVLSCQPLVLGS